MRGSSIWLASLLGCGAAACSVIAGIDTFSSPTAGALGVDASIDAAIADADASDVRTPILPLDACACDAANATVCYAGDCYPKEIASALTPPDSIAVVGKMVVWNEPGASDGEGSIRGCATDGPPCADNAVTVSNIKQYRPHISPAGFGTDGVLTVFESERPSDSPSSISQITAPAVMMEVSSVPGAEGPVIGAAASKNWIAYASSASIVAVDRAKGARGSIAIAPTQKLTRMGIAGTRLVSITADDGALQGCTLPLCSDLVSYPPLNYPAVADFFIDGTDVHIVATQNATTGALITHPLAGFANGGAPVPLPGRGKIAVDAQRVYVTVPSVTKIFAVEKSTRALSLLYQTDATAIAADAEFLYWISGSKIVKAPK